jgi:Tol biopolymer transport system component
MLGRRGHKRIAFSIPLVFVLVLGLIPALPRLPGMPAQFALALVGTTTRVSSAPGIQANGESRGASIAPDAQIAAFWSVASNLVTGDNNTVADVFVYDAGVTTRVSVGLLAEANGASISPSLSGDGRYVTFQSAATNLVQSDDNVHQDIFVYDRQAATTELVSVTTAGAQGQADSFAGDITPDGRYVAFWSAASLDQDISTGSVQIFVRDRQLSTTRLASVALNGFGVGSIASSPSISDDGRFVAFSTAAANVVPGDTNGLNDVFVRDMVNSTTVRVSVGPAGLQGNGTSVHSAISGDGRFVAFDSTASNLLDTPDDNGATDMFVRDTFAGTTTRSR